MGERLSAEAHAALVSASVQGNKVILTCGALPRPLYEEVDEVLKRLGGTWKGGRTRAHVFSADPTDLLNAVRDSAEMPPKNPLAFYATPPAVVGEMYDLLTLFPFTPRRILEPSAGQGAIATMIRDEYLPLAAPDADLVLVERDSWNATILRGQGFAVAQQDFLEYPVPPADQRFDIVVMNPPFAVADNPTAYIDHIRHAWAMVAPEGLLIAVAPAGLEYGNKKAVRDLRLLIDAHGGMLRLPASAFKASGTEVGTVLCTMRKYHQDWRRETYNGWRSWHAWVVWLWATNEYDHWMKLERMAQQEMDVDLFGYPIGSSLDAIRRWVDDAVEIARKGGDPAEPDAGDIAVLIQEAVGQMNELRAYAERPQPIATALDRAA